MVLHRSILWAMAWGVLPALAVAGERLDLARQIDPSRIASVALEMQVGGHLEVKKQADSASTAALEKIPLMAKFELAYDEQTSAGSGQRPQAARLYTKTSGNTMVSGRMTRRQFRDDRKLVLARNEEAGLRLYGVEGSLHRDELATILLPADSLAVDQLLPTDPVALGDTWGHSSDAMRALLALDEVTVCECQSVLTKSNSRFAICEMAGTVHGRIEGADTELEVKAIYLVDFQLGWVAEMNLALREKRSLGPVTPGFAGVSKIHYTCNPAAGDTPLTDERIQAVASAYPVPATALETSSEKLGFRVRHDREWFANVLAGKSMTFRRVDTAGLVTHATVASLPPTSVSDQTATESFYHDVTSALGDALTKVVSDSSWTNQHGCQVLCIVAEGQVDGAPIEWHAYQVCPPEGATDMGRLALTFTVEKSQADVLDQHDRRLVDRIELLPQITHTAGKSKKQK